MAAKISPAEWEVLSALWERAPATAAEICERLSKQQKWHPKTVGTFLLRLVRKGMIRVQRADKANSYVPVRTREECLRAESASFLQRVYRGACGPLLLHFVEQADLTGEEVRELERLLKQKRKSS